MRRLLLGESIGLQAELTESRRQLSYLLPGDDPLDPSGPESGGAVARGAGLDATEHAVRHARRTRAWMLATLAA